MTMKNINPGNLIILLALAAVMPAMFFVSGCGEQPTNTTTTAAIGPIGGTQGLVLSFSDSIPKQIYEGQKFNIIILIRNAGETSVEATKAKISLSPTDINEHNLADGTKTNTRYLAARFRSDNTIVDVGSEPITFKDAIVSKGTYPQGGGKDRISATVCYPYATTGISDICLGSANIYGETTGGECNPYTPVSIKNTGAPIQITKVTPTPDVTSGTYTFLIEAQNKGKGNIVNEDCSVVEGASINVPVKIKGGWIGGETKSVNCEGGMDFAMGGKGIVTCTVQGPANLERSELSSMTIELGRYWYKEYATTSIDIKVKPEISSAAQAKAEEIKEGVIERVS